MQTKRHTLKALMAAAMVLCLCDPVWAHGASVGSLRIEHPYAMPDVAVANQWVVYFRGLRNEGDSEDRLVSASSPVANAVVLQQVLPPAGANQVVAISAIALAPKSTTPMRHNLGEYRLLLKDLKQPIKEGDRIDLTLTFAHAGAETVKVYVQAGPAADSSEHKH
jgi:copper(I)-binding protein